MPTLTITDAAAKKLKAASQTDYFDPAYSGLVLRVTPAGVKSWGYVYRIHGKQRRMTFDRYPAMSVAEAHDAWRSARALVQAGKDPTLSGKPTDEGPTDFAGVAAEWIRRDQAENRSVKIVQRTLEREVLSFWGKRPISEISRRDVRDIIDRIADTGRTTTARRCHAHLHRLFQWAIGRDIITSNPVSGMEKPGSENVRDRVLTDIELRKVWDAAERVWYPYGPVFQLLTLTGARRNEIGHLRWSEIQGDTIRLNGSRTKNGEPHLIPLSTPALALLESLPRIAGNDFVFGSALSGWSKAKIWIDAHAQVDAWVIHDLRRTVATGLQKMGVPLPVTESVLGHTSGSRSGIVGVYQRHDYAAEKRSALEAWGAHVMAVVDGGKRGKVVAFGKR